jgi:maltose/maltodextrin transport system permease protein
MDRTFQSGESYPFNLYKTDNGYRIAVTDGDQILASDDFIMGEVVDKNLTLKIAEQITGEKEKIKAIIKNKIFKVETYKKLPVI